MEAWERQPGEPGRWFARFELYRAAGPGRSMLALYNGEREKAQKARKGATIPGAWRLAAERWRWHDRAAAWDAAIRAAALAIWEQDYQAAIVAHRDHALLLAGEAFRLAVTVLRALNIRIEAIDPAEIPLALIPGLLRAATAVAEAALNSEAQALAVDELIRRLADRPLIGNPMTVPKARNTP